jgi:hypothetical protein
MEQAQLNGKDSEFTAEFDDTLVKILNERRKKCVAMVRQNIKKMFKGNSRRVELRRLRESMKTCMQHIQARKDTQLA